MQVHPFSQITSEYRKAQKMTLRQFGQALGVSRTAVMEWERGGYLPDEGKLLPLAVRSGGWVREFAFDGLAALQPGTYPPAGEIGKRVLAPDGTQPAAA